MPIHFWCIFIAWIHVYLCKLPVAVAMQQAGGYDNHNPRDQQAGLAGWGKRALAAHQNGFEGFAPFAVAVLVAHIGGGPAAWLDGLAAAFVISRFAYLACYMVDLATLRSLVWTVGWFCTFALFLSPLF